MPQLAPRIPPVPSGITGDLARYLGQIARQLNGEAYISRFSGSNPNVSAITGIPGDFVVNIGAASDSSRLWVKSGSTVRSSTTGWVQHYIGGSGAASSLTHHVVSTDTGFASLTFRSIPNMGFAVTSGGRYHFRYETVFRASNTTQPPQWDVTAPAATVFAYRGYFPNTADGINDAWQGWGTASADAISPAETPSAGDDYMGTIVGVIVPSSDGTVQLRAASGAATSRTTVREGTCGFLTTL
jgi:hypothetical protein